MSFRNNLQYLRATHNMTQEQLAMLLGVSRQSVTKWESERAYPEMDKLVKMCGIFGCTLDGLVQGDLTKAPVRGQGVPAQVVAPGKGALAGGAASPGAAASLGQVAPLGVPAPSPSSDGSASGDASCAALAADSSAAAGAPGPQVAYDAFEQAGLAGIAGVGVPGVQQDVCGYDAHMRSFAWRIATGVALIILGAAAAAFFDGLPTMSLNPLEFSADTAGGLAVFAGVALGLAFLIPAGMEHSSFVKAHPFVADFYTQDQREKSNHLLAWAVVAGIVCILFGCGLGVVFEEAGNKAAEGGVVLACVAVGVWLFIRFGIMHSRLNLANHNQEVTETLAQFMTDEQIAAIEDPVRREAVREEKRYTQVTGAVCGIIMLVATVIALLMLFVGLSGGELDAMKAGTWEPGGTMLLFWLPWPIGGILCGVAALVVRLVMNR